MCVGLVFRSADAAATTAAELVMPGCASPMGCGDEAPPQMAARSRARLLPRSVAGAAVAPLLQRQRSSKAVLRPRPLASAGGPARSCRGGADAGAWAGASRLLVYLERAILDASLSCTTTRQEQSSRTKSSGSSSGCGGCPARCAPAAPTAARLAAVVEGIDLSPPIIKQQLRLVREEGGRRRKCYPKTPATRPTQRQGEAKEGERGLEARRELIALRASTPHVCENWSQPAR